jgi:4-hydroxybenzoate polyprenyltransferase
MARLRSLTVIVIFSVVGMSCVGVVVERHIADLLRVIILLFFWYLNGTCINDIADIEIDKVNLRNAKSRPFANSLTTRAQLIRIAVFSATACLSVALTISAVAFGACVLALLLNYAYSMPPIRISYRGVYAIMLLPIGYVLLPILLAVLSVEEPFSRTATVLTIGLYVSFMGRIILKDFRDVVGDRRFGKRTFLVRYGDGATVITSSLLWVVGTMLSVYALSTINIVTAYILICHLVVILWALGKFYLKLSRDDQQVIIGSIAKTATASLICIIIAFGVHNGAYHISTFVGNLLQAAIAVYAGLLAIFYSKNTSLAKVSY